MLMIYKVARKDKSSRFWMIFAKSEKELETFISTIWIYSKDTGRKILNSKCMILIIKKRETRNNWKKGTTLPGKPKKS